MDASGPGCEASHPAGAGFPCGHLISSQHLNLNQSPVSQRVSWIARIPSLGHWNMGAHVPEVCLKVGRLQRDPRSPSCRAPSPRTDTFSAFAKRK